MREETKTRLKAEAAPPILCFQLHAFAIKKKKRVERLVWLEQDSSGGIYSEHEGA